MKKNNKQEPELLREFLGFGAIFGLSFLQSIFGKGEEAPDPEFEAFLQGQENLEPVIDKIKAMEKEDMDNPKKRNEFLKYMDAMPDEIKEAASGQFAAEAGNSVNNAEEALAAVAQILTKAAGALTASAEEIGADPEELKKVYAKFAGPVLRQLVALWGHLISSLKKAQEKDKMHPEMKGTVSLDFDPSEFAGQLSEACQRLVEAEGAPSDDDKGTATKEVEHWSKRFLQESGIAAALANFKTKLESMGRFATDESSVFGIGTDPAGAFIKRFGKTLEQTNNMLQLRFPNAVMKIAKGATSAGGAYAPKDAASMSQDEKIEATGRIITSLKKAMKDKDVATVQGLIPQLKAFAPKQVLQQIAKNYPKLAPSLNEHLKRQTFYESFGDFS